MNNGKTKDDLKCIRGIGPHIEQKLNEIGVTSYDQIAKFNEVEISFVSRYIGHSPVKIKRAQWVNSARQLLFKKESKAISSL